MVISLFAFPEGGKEEGGRGRRREMGISLFAFPVRSGREGEWGVGEKEGKRAYRYRVQQREGRRQEDEGMEGGKKRKEMDISLTAFVILTDGRGRKDEIEMKERE